MLKQLSTNMLHVYSQENQQTVLPVKPCDPGPAKLKTPPALARDARLPHQCPHLSPSRTPSRPPPAAHPRPVPCSHIPDPPSQAGITSKSGGSRLTVVCISHMSCLFSLHPHLPSVVGRAKPVLTFPSQETESTPNGHPLAWPPGNAAFRMTFVSGSRKPATASGLCNAQQSGTDGHTPVGTPRCRVFWELCYYRKFFLLKKSARKLLIWT